MSRRNDLMQKRFKMVGQDFRNNLVIEVGKTYRPKMINVRRIIHLGNERNISMIEFLQHISPSKKRLNRSNNITG